MPKTESAISRKFWIFDHYQKNWLDRNWLDKNWLDRNWLDKNKAPGVKIYKLFNKQIGLSGTKLAEDHQRRITRELYETLWIVFEGKRIKNLKSVPVVILNFFQFWSKLGSSWIQLRWFQKSKRFDSRAPNSRVKN